MQFSCRQRSCAGAVYAWHGRQGSGIVPLTRSWVCAPAVGLYHTLSLTEPSWGHAMQATSL